MNQSVTETAVNGRSAGAMRLLAQAVESYLASRSDTPTLLKQAMAEDPDCLMATCFMGYLTRLAGDRANARRSSAFYETLAARVHAGDGTERERAHVGALGLWLADDLHTLMDHFERLLDTWPTDVLALRLLHYLYFYDGDSLRMRDAVARRLSDYAGHPLESYVKGMLAFGLEEAGDYETAERLGREAVDARADDIWAAHAVAHVMEMHGRVREGVAWLCGLRPQWRHANNFRFHLDWHEALYHLAAGDADAALRLYDESVGPAVADDFYLDLCNAASLLLRLEARGVDTGDRWSALSAVAEHHADDAELVFASLHYLMPLLRTGSPAAGRLRGVLAVWAHRDTTQGHVVRDVGLAVADFLTALEAGDAAAAGAQADAFHAGLHRIGGSRAQRQLFHIIRPRGHGRP